MNPCATARIVAALIALCAVPALAQHPYRTFPPDAMVFRYCMAPQLTGGPMFDEVETIVQRLAVTNQRVQFAVVNTPRTGAWESEVSVDISLLCIPAGLVHLMGNSEGKLAFIVGHEVGHAIDDRCKSASGREQAAERSPSGATLALLFGRGSGDGAVNQRACEVRADEIGLSLMSRAGYDPQDAPAALEMLAEHAGDHSDGVLARLGALRDDHPITADRVRHLRKLISRKSRKAAEQMPDIEGSSATQK